MYTLYFYHILVTFAWIARVVSIPAAGPWVCPLDPQTNLSPVFWTVAWQFVFLLRNQQRHVVIPSCCLYNISTFEKCKQYWYNDITNNCYILRKILGTDANNLNDIRVTITYKFMFPSFRNCIKYAKLRLNAIMISFWFLGIVLSDGHSRGKHII
jgi:hypothetical protein